MNDKKMISFTEYIKGEYGYSRFNRVEKIKALLDSSYIKGDIYNYLVSKYTKGFEFKEYICENTKGGPINYVDYIQKNIIKS